MNPFAGARGDNKAMRPFAKLFLDTFLFSGSVRSD